MFETVRIGIIGTGWIAEKMAITLQGMGDDVIAYGVASRDADRAKAFAQKWELQTLFLLTRQCYKTNILIWFTLLLLILIITSTLKCVC